MRTALPTDPAVARMFRLWLAGVLVLLAGLATNPAFAQLRVDMSGVGATQYPIAIADFTGDPQGMSVAEVVRADLTRSGQFRLVNATGANLSVETSVNYDEWRTRGADYLAYGSISQAGGQYTVSYRLVDSVRQNRWTVSPSPAPKRNCAASLTKLPIVSMKKLLACGGSSQLAWHTWCKKATLTSYKLQTLTVKIRR